MARSIWRGAVTFGMVSIPVKLYAATDSQSVSFNQLHKSDHGRVKYRKVCELDDAVLQADDIVRGYEIGKDQYVEIEDKDLERLPVPSKHTVEITSFVKVEEIDPIYYDRSYYLEPEPAGLKPYALLMKALRMENRLAVAKIALREKERLCVLRPMEGGTLVLETLYYPDEVRLGEAPQIPDVLASEKELLMARQLVEALQEPFNPAVYRDDYREALMQLVAVKQGSAEGVVKRPQPGETPTETTDLMAALRASVQAVEKSRGPRPSTAPDAAATAPRASKRPARGGRAKQVA